MAIIDLFSKRQKQLRGDVPDIYQYDKIPQPFRIQIVHMWLEYIGNVPQYPYANVGAAYDLLVRTLRKEYGVFSLVSTDNFKIPNSLEEFTKSFMAEKNYEKCLDYIELSFKFINNTTRTYHYMGVTDAYQKADEAIAELNGRFKEHGIGYQFINNEIIRIDSELIHSEVVKPALKLLSQKQYAGAQEEFLKAHEHYRKGSNKESLNECLKSFESVMKSICDKRKWAYPPSATSKALINICLQNELIPSFWQQQFESLRVLLESSIPTGRNKLSGHGQGSEPVYIPEHIVAYMLHMTAASIVFLAEADNKMS